MAALISAFWLWRSGRGGWQFYCRGFASGLAIRLFARFNSCGEVVPLAADCFDQTRERVPQFDAALFEIRLASLPRIQTLTRSVWASGVPTA